LKKQGKPTRHISGFSSSPEITETITEEKNMVDINIPEIPLEDFEVEENVFDEVADESGGALTYAFVGLGQGGGRIAQAFYDMGYKKTLAVNTAVHDLELLDLPDEHKYHVNHLGDSGAGKDQEKGEAAFVSREQEVFNKMRQIFGEKVDRIIVCVGVAGGTGGGGVVPLINLAKKYFAYVGIKDANDRVGVITSLPTNGEAASPTVASNAYTKTNTLCDMAEKGEFAPLIIVDNGKIKKLYPKLTVKQFWPTINNTVAGLFHVFNVLATQNSNYTTFDPADYDSIMKSHGCMILGVTGVKDFESETGISTAIKSNLEKTLLAEGFDLKTATAAGAVVVGGTTMFEEVEGLMDNMEYSFDTLAALTGNAIIHRGIYEDPKREKLVVYTVIGGMKRPQSRLEDLKKFMKLSK